VEPPCHSTEMSAFLFFFMAPPCACHLVCPPRFMRELWVFRPLFATRSAVFQAGSVNPVFVLFPLPFPETVPPSPLVMCQPMVAVSLGLGRLFRPEDFFFFKFAFFSFLGSFCRLTRTGSFSPFVPCSPASPPASVPTNSHLAFFFSRFGRGRGGMFLFPYCRQNGAVPPFFLVVFWFFFPDGSPR